MAQSWQLVFSLSFPIACLLLVLWLARLEDTLARDVRRSEHQAEPEPILRIPVQALATVRPQASAVSRSAAASLGGSTKR